MNNYNFSFEKLEVWKIAKEFTISIYRITKGFPKEEQFGLISQLNRAAISIVSNLAEGSARKTNKDKAHFYLLAYGSLMEVTSLLIIAKDLTLINNEKYNKSREIIAELSNKINALHKFQLNNYTIKQLHEGNPC